MEAVVALFAVFFGYSFPVILIVLIIWLKTSEKKKRCTLQSELYAKMIEKGQELPKDLFAFEEKSKNSSLRNGILLIATGIGVFLFFWIAKIFPTEWDSDGLKAAATGIIPGLIGIGYLLIYFIEKRQKKDDEQ